MIVQCTRWNKTTEELEYSMKKGIIFDVDGTLWDACEVVAESWNEYLEKEAKDVPVHLTEQDLRRVMGKTMTQIGDALFPMVEPGRRAEVTEGCCVYEVDYLKRVRGGTVYPHVREIMERLSGTYHLYIVSNCQEGYIEDFIQWAGVGDLIEDFESFGNTGLEKYENIRLVVERNGLDSAVYVGDTQGDYESTCRAELPFLHARYGFGKVDESLPYINDLEELPAAVEKIIGK